MGMAYFHLSRGVMHLSMLSPRGGGLGIGGAFDFLSKFSIKCPTVGQ